MSPRTHPKTLFGKIRNHLDDFKDKRTTITSPLIDILTHDLDDFNCIPGSHIHHATPIIIVHSLGAFQKRRRKTALSCVMDLEATLDYRLKNNIVTRQIEILFDEISAELISRLINCARIARELNAVMVIEIIYDLNKPPIRLDETILRASTDRD